VSHKPRKRKKARPSPTLAAVLIVKNEEQNIGPCLDSVRAFVDELLVMDTGSTDRTIDVARALGARIAHFTWIDDFAAARNAALDAARADWVLSMDADEYLESGGHLLRQLVAQPLLGQDGYHLQLINIAPLQGGWISTRSPRLFPRAGVRWVGALHERVRSVRRAHALWIAAPQELTIVHAGYVGTQATEGARLERNTRIAEESVAADPRDAHALFALAETYVAAERYAECVDAVQRFLEVAEQEDDLYTWWAYHLWIYSAVETDDAQGVAAAEHAARSTGSLTALAHRTLAGYAEKQGDLETAALHLRAALDPRTPNDQMQTANSEAWRVRVQLGMLLAQIGDFGGFDQEIYQAERDLRHRA
jgi:glycosyltransferase involved in cell wall biosynthesis